MLRSAQHVVWDWNGTLIDDAWLCLEVMNEVLARRGLPLLTPERYASIFRFPVRAYYAELGFDFAADPFEVVGTEFIGRYHERDHECALRPGARSLLEALSDTGVSQWVLSASRRAGLRHQAARLEVDQFFAELMGLDDHYAAGKVELGRDWLARSGAPPDRVVLVGDTDHDAEVARELGIRCILVPSGHQSRDRLEGTGAPVVASLEAVWALGR